MDIKKKTLKYLFIVLLPCTVYLQNLSFDYTYLDDNLIVFEEFEKINSLTDIPTVLTGGYLYNNYYRPMIMLSFIADTAIAGQSSFMYHLTNLIIHLFVSVLVYHLLIKITKKESLSLLFTLLFSIHPLNVNAVSWIAGRNDLLVALFSLLSILSFIKYWEGNGKKYLIMFSVSYIFAMFSKEIGVLIPIIMASYIILLKPISSSLLNTPEIKKNKKKLFGEINFAVASFVIPVSTYLLLRFNFSPVRVREEISLASFFQNINIPFEYIGKVFYFFEFSPLSMTNITLAIIGGIATLIVLIIFLKGKKTERRKFLFGTAMFLLFVLPPVFVRVSASDSGFNYIDCRAYLPLIGMLIVLISIIPHNFKLFIGGRFKRIITTVTVGIIFLYTMLFSAAENQYYRNGEIFWSRLTEIYPERATYWMGLGFYYFDNKDFSKAAFCAEKAINLKPQTAEYYKKGSLAYMKAGDNANAIRLQEIVLNLESESSNTFLNLIKNYLALGNIPEAKKYGEKLLNYSFEKISNDSEVQFKRKKAEILYSAAYLFYNSNYYDQSSILLKKAISLHSSEVKFHNLLGIIFIKCEMKDSAETSFLKALKLEPSNKDAISNLQLMK